jgi:hypothetical protein
MKSHRWLLSPDAGKEREELATDPEGVNMRQRLDKSHLVALRSEKEKEGERLRLRRISLWLK